MHQSTKLLSTLSLFLLPLTSAEPCLDACNNYLSQQKTCSESWAQSYVYGGGLIQGGAVGCLCQGFDTPNVYTEMQQCAQCSTSTLNTQQTALLSDWLVVCATWEANGGGNTGQGLVEGAECWNQNLNNYAPSTGQHCVDTGSAAPSTVGLNSLPSPTSGLVPVAGTTQTGAARRMGSRAIVRGVAAGAVIGLLF